VSRRRRRLLRRRRRRLPGTGWVSRRTPERCVGGRPVAR